MLGLFLAGSSSHLAPRRSFQVAAVEWLDRLPVEEGPRSPCWRLVMLTTSSEWRGTAGLRCVVWLWILLSILMVVVTINISVMLAQSGVMLLLVKRLVSLLLGELVVLEDRLLPLPPRLTRFNDFHLRHCFWLLSLPVRLFQHFLGCF